MPLCLYMYGTFLLFLLPSPAQLSCHSGGPISRPSFLHVHVSMPLWQEWSHMSQLLESYSEGLSHRA